MSDVEEIDQPVVIEEEEPEIEEDRPTVKAEVIGQGLS